MKSLSTETFSSEQKIVVQNKFIIKICKEYHTNKAEVGDFKYSIIDKFRLFLLSKNIILPNNAKNLIIKKINVLHSRLIAPSDSVEFEVITDWNIEFNTYGRDINEDKKVYCQYFKDWFISGNI